MSGFNGYYALIEDDYRLWTYWPYPDDPLTYTASDGRKFVMNEKFLTDGATVPRFFWAIPGLDPMDWPKAAVLHDWIWEQRYVGKNATGFFGSNWLLFEAMRSLGWSWILCAAVWMALTMFGWYYWMFSLSGRIENG